VRNNSIARESRLDNGVFALVGGRVTRVMADPPPPELQTMQGGYGFIVSRSHPRSCLTVLPSSVAVDHDIDGDGKADGIAKVSVSRLDLNNNGVPDEGDFVLLVPMAFAITRDGVRLILNERILRDVCQDVAGRI
jgi:hypothetical protein